MPDRAATGRADNGCPLVPAGFLARHAAWSLDATVIAAASWLLTRHAIAAAALRLHAAWIHLQQVVAGHLVDVLGQAVDPVGPAVQLMQDAALQAAATMVEASLRALLLPPALTFMVLAAIYWIGFERSAWQATPGKRALGLQVVDLRGGRPGLARAAGRHFAGALSWLTLNLGHALAALPPHKRALHDYLAGTRVVHADDDPRLPGWASAWIGLQVLLAFALPAWLLLRYVAALREILLQG